jgi:hypothetical protein
MVWIGMASAFSQQSQTAFEQMLMQIEQAVASPSVQDSTNTLVADTLQLKERERAVWNVGAINSLNFSQMALSNWAAGGQSSLTLNAFTDFSAKMKKRRQIWENRFQAAYGFIHTYGDRDKKSDDKLVLDSKWGYQAYDKLYVSVAFNFTSQIAYGYDYPKDADPRKISSFMTPGYFSLGVGIDYKPFDFFSMNFSPLTSKFGVVTDPQLRVKYGNRADQKVRPELGAQLKADLKKEVFPNVVLVTGATFFSDYLRNPSKIKVKWDLLIDMKVNKFLSANFRTNMIYDEDIKITDRNGNVGPRLQIKEVFGVGLTMSFGSK